MELVLFQLHQHLNQTLFHWRVYFKQQKLEIFSSKICIQSIHEATLLKAVLKLFIISLAILFYWSTPLKNLRSQYKQQSLNMGKFTQLLLALEQRICYTCNHLNSFREAHISAGFSLKINLLMTYGTTEIEEKNLIFPREAQTTKLISPPITESDYSFHDSNFLRRKQKVLLFIVPTQIGEEIVAPKIWKVSSKWHEKITSEEGECLLSVLDLIILTDN